MKILFTGASSFTGIWFVQELTKAGHEVTACFRSSEADYTGLRSRRIQTILSSVHAIFNAPFGTESFLNAIEKQSYWDLFCHHGAETADYKHPDFNFAHALANNTLNIKTVLRLLMEKGCRKIILTGSVFEQNEGLGTDQLRAVSPYGLSKGLTTDVFRYFTSIMGIKLGKFVIPNPFGPYEEERFTTYLVRNWAEGKNACVNTPDYLRDNIHVSLLARAYSDFAARLSANLFEKFNPSGYVETQGAFTERFAKEIGQRLNLDCRYELKPQMDFIEPAVRLNMDRLDPQLLKWNEKEAWDQLASYYQAFILNDKKI